MKDDTHKATNATLDSFQRVTKATQAIASEIADYSKRSFDTSAETAERLFGVRSLDKAIEVQNEFAKTSFERYVAHAGKLGELYTNLAKEALKPYEGFIAK
jgi:phasin family protein